MDYSIRLPAWCDRFHESNACPPGSIVFDDYGNEYLVVRRIRGATYMLVPKYIRKHDMLERIVRTYSAASVEKAALKAGMLRFEPNYSVTVPATELSNGTWFCCPSFGEHVTGLIAIVPSLRRTRCHRDCLGVTGSLLAGHWSPTYSDIDLLVDTSLDCIEVIEDISKLVKPLPKSLYLQWLNEEARHRKLTINWIRDLPTRWQRGIIDNHVVSVAPVNLELRISTEKRFFFIDRKRWIHREICLDKFHPSLGDYPAIVEGNGGCLVLYDGFYVPRLLEGGCFAAEGPVVDVVSMTGLSHKGCIGVGGREGGYLRLLHLPP